MKYSPASEPSADYMALRVLTGLGMLPLVLAGALLLVVSVTWTGRACALLAIGTAILPWMGFTACAKRTKKWTARVLGLTCVIVALAGFVLARTPPSTMSAMARVSHQFGDGKPRLSGFSPGNLVPEVDQLMFGFTVMPLIDRLLTVAQASELKRLTATIYRELETDDGFKELGSMMPEAYLEILGLPSGSVAEAEMGASGAAQPSAAGTHAYVYVPAGLDRSKPAPVLVFFHGSGGNFKAYLWILAGLADQLNCVLVAPGNGLGFWKGSESTAAFDDALAMAARIAAVDRSRVDIVGLSNGGLAVSRLMPGRCDQIRSLVFLSPVFDERIIDAQKLEPPCMNKPILTITGEYDDRVPSSYVRNNVGRLAISGLKAELRTLPADHFMFFSHRHQVLELMERWIGSLDLK